MIKLFALLITLSTLQNCNGQKEDLRFVKATSQKWSGGAVGSGKGYYYTVYLSVKDKENFSIDSLWVHGKRIEAKVAIEKYSGDTLVVKANEFYPGTLNQNNDGSAKEPTDSPLPSGLKGEGVLLYNINGVKKYFAISQFQKLPDLNYP